jgi:hypothetical protein
MYKISQNIYFKIEAEIYAVLCIVLFVGSNSMYGCMWVY